MREIKKRINDAIGAHYPQGEVNALARIIATELLGLPQTTYFLNDPVTLTAEEERMLGNALERLTKNEPIQYILGYSDFCSLRFKVTPAVLIPRPETSELVEWVAQEADEKAKILDIGTGSGCIAVSLSHKLKASKITAWDISPQALEVAKENNKSNGCTVNFELRDILTYEPEDEKFDIIVSNPPYIKELEKKEMDNNVLLWEPHLALFVPNENPLLFYRTIAEKAVKMLPPGGKLFFEINREHGKETCDMLHMLGYTQITLRKDFDNNDRMIMAVKQ